MQRSRPHFSSMMRRAADRDAGTTPASSASEGATMQTRDETASGLGLEVLAQDADEDPPRSGPSLRASPRVRRLEEESVLGGGLSGHACDDFVAEVARAIATTLLGAKDVLPSRSPGV